MASVSTDKNGLRRIQFAGIDGARKTIRLGKVSKKNADAVRVRVEQLLEAATLETPMPSDLAKWVSSQSDKLADKLARAGLIPSRKAKGTTTLGPFLTDYITNRTDVKPASKLIWGHARRNLVSFFGETCDVRTITPGDADKFKLWLLEQELASTTVSKRLQITRQFFRAMLRRRLLDENPFEDVKSTAAGIADRQRFVTREEITRVIEACPDHHWRTIVTLSRYGGLRCPSEVLSLRWQDVNWGAKRIVVHAPKTEHHPDKATRTIPLFPELKSALEEAWELAPDGAEYVVDPKYRKAAMGPGGWANANLRTTLLKIIDRAGLQTWPRLFHNLRTSRETELAELYPVHVVAGWLGHTPRIAIKHYLMTTAEHFEDAVRVDDQKATQKATQQASAMPEMGCEEPQVETTAHEKTPVVQGFASRCDVVQQPKVVPAGFEPATSTV